MMIGDAKIGNIATPLLSINKFCGANYIVSSMLTEV